MAYLNEYERLGHLGKGANARVYKVRHIKLGYVRAVRELTDYIKDEDDKLYKSFLEECKILLKLGNGGHPNIVRIYQPRLLQNTALVEMDYVKGYDIDDFLKKNNHFIPIEEVQRFILDISSALAYCHVDIHEFLMDKNEDNLKDDPEDGSKLLIDGDKRQELIKKYGITHNDIHSKNIMRKYDGSYILLDFGLAIQNGKAVKSSSRRDGAVEYKAPEKWDNEQIISEQSDIYSFGILMYEMLAGQVPFPFNEGKYSNELQALNELREQHLNTPPPAIEPLRKVAYEKTNSGKPYEKDYPDQLEQVIMKCIEKNSKNRYVNAKELYGNIKGIFEQIELTKNKTIVDLIKQKAELTNNIQKLIHENYELKMHLHENSKLNKETKLLIEDTLQKLNTTIATDSNLLKKEINISILNDNNISNESNKTFLHDIDLILIEGGTFTMGYTSEQGRDCDDDEKPAHKVTVNSFQISKTEITNSQYAFFLNIYRIGANGTYNGNQLIDIKSSYLQLEYINNKWRPKSKYGNSPMVCVTWYGAYEYCYQAGGRLPTEAEWEYAARGGNKSRRYKYSGSDIIDEIAWYKNNSNGKVQEVATKKPNELDLYDMSGNVREWCYDWFGSYSSAIQNNPKGPSSGSYRILRGGSRYDDAHYCRSSFRSHSPPTGSYHDLGFRLVIP